MERQAIRGSTRLVALLGYPVAHSLSPQIHNHAFARLGLPFAYVPLAVHPTALHTALNTLRACSFAGANVTIPHKAAVLPYCDRISELSALTGTVNTLYFRDGHLWGTTTDPEGFSRTLAKLGCGLGGANAVIVGNGGTARTLGFALAMGAEVDSLTFLGRNAKRVGALAAEISRRTGFAVGSDTLTSTGGRDALAACNLLVNCTPVGMHPNVDATPVPRETLHGGMTVFDTVYNPAATLLLRHAREAGARTTNGLPMLLYQGLASFTYWTGVEVDDSLYDLDELEAMIGQGGENA